jgi:peptide/nickel transport system permease protein
MTLASRSRDTINLIRLDRNLLSGTVITLTFIIIAIFTQLISPYDPLKGAMGNRIANPSFEHILGTDNLGRDVFSRILWGSRVSLLVGVFSVLIGSSGIVLGLIAGYFGGKIDYAITRLFDVLLAFPGLLMALLVVAFLGFGVGNSILAIGVTLIPGFGRLVRGETFSIKEREFVLVSNAMGLNTAKILFRHIFPHMLASIMVYTTYSFAAAILIETGLSFLGLGVQPPTPSWGRDAYIHRVFLQTAPWIPLSSGFMLAILVAGLTLMGSGLRDVLDPRLRRQMEQEAISLTF